MKWQTRKIYKNSKFLVIDDKDGHLGMCPLRLNIPIDAYEPNKTYLYGGKTEIPINIPDTDKFMYIERNILGFKDRINHELLDTKYNSTWKFFNADGTLRDGFVTDTDGNIRYYFPDGTFANDWITIAGTKYFFNSLGVMIGKNVKNVIDVSEYQGYIDWDTVISQGGVDGVILRIAAGCEQEDAMLARNIAELQRLGIPYGIYIYSYAENYEEGKLYANFTLEMIRKYNMNPTLGIYLDLESNNITSYMGTYEYEQVTKGFMEVMNNNGYGSITKIYTYKDYADTVLNSDYLRSLIAWVAQYNHYCYYSGSYVGWQYSSTETVPGIAGNVDVSVWF